MPRQARPRVDSTILEMAILGYQREVERISAKIADIKARLGQRGPGRPKATAAAAVGTDHAGPQKRRTISKAGRERAPGAAGEGKGPAGPHKPPTRTKGGRARGPPPKRGGGGGGKKRSG